MLTRTSFIRTYQLFCILLLSRLLPILTLVSIGTEQPSSTDYLVSVFFAGIFILILSIPMLLLLKYYPQMDIVDVAYCISPKLSKIVSLLYALFFSYFAFITLSTLKLFVATSVFPNDESTLFILICIVASCYAATLGLEALGRASTVALGIFVFSFLFIICIMLDKVNLLNFTPLFSEGVSPSVKFGIRMASITHEIAMIFVLAPRVKGNKQKMYAGWLFSLLLLVFVIFFFTFSGLGEFAVRQLFPVYSMAVLSEFSVFQRFDVLLTGVWILTAFLKISLLFYLQSELLKKSFGEKLKHQYIYILGFLIFILQFVLRGRLSNYAAITNLSARSIVAFLFLFFIPLVLFLFVKLKSKTGGHRANV